MPPTGQTNERTIQTSDLEAANKALDAATGAIADARSTGTMPAANTVIELDQKDGTYQKLNDAKSDIDTALRALGGKPCGGGRPC